MNDLTDSDSMCDDIVDGLSRAEYRRPVVTFARRRSRYGLTVGALGAAGITVAGIIGANPGDDRIAYGWTPTARSPTAAERAVALKACDLVRSTTTAGGITSVATTKNTGPVANMTLDTLDIRGTTALATLHGEDFVHVCELDSLDESATHVAGLVLYGPDLTTLTVLAVLDMFEGRTLIYGFTPANAATVEIDVPGLPTLHADVRSGIFATWVPTSEWSPDSTARAQDRAGGTIATQQAIKTRPAPTPGP